MYIIYVVVGIYESILKVTLKPFLHFKGNKLLLSFKYGYLFSHWSVLVGDFVVLLLVCRQALVFRIELRHDGHEYAGGTNKQIVDDVERQGFVNPVPDYISHAR